MMADFAVKVAELDGDTDRCRWVLAVDPVGDRLLVVHEDRTLHWHPMDDCTFAKMVPPDGPVPVVAVQPQQKPKIEPVAGLRNLNGRPG